MVQRGSRIASMPPYAQGVAHKLNLLGFTDFIFFENERLGDDSKVVQIRDIDTQAPNQTVANYSDLMKNGTQFPPIVYTSDGYTLDGTTRRLAARRAKLQSHPAFILREAWEGAPAALEERFIIAAAALNLEHGKNISVQNREAVILKVLGNNPEVAPDDLARQLGISRATVTSTITAQRARDRAARIAAETETDLVGIEKFTKSHWADLGAARMRHVDDGVFIDLVQIAAKGNLSTKEMRGIEDRVLALGTDAERRKVLAGESDSRVLVTKGIAKKPANSARLRQTLGFLLGFKDNWGSLVEIGSETAAAEHRRVLAEADYVLRKLQIDQEDYDRKRFGSVTSVTTE